MENQYNYYNPDDNQFQNNYSQGENNHQKKSKKMYSFPITFLINFVDLSKNFLKLSLTFRTYVEFAARNTIHNYLRIFVILTALSAF